MSTSPFWVTHGKIRRRIIPRQTTASREDASAGTIVARLPVKNQASVANQAKSRGRGRKKKVRRQSHGSAWHWKQTDSWYYTLPGTKKRVPLFDEDGVRIRGIENKKAAQLAKHATLQLAQEMKAG
jgi:hypothetical protein